MQRRAHPIGVPGQPIDAEVDFRWLLRHQTGGRVDAVNGWHLLRFGFDLPGPADAAALQVTADGRYQLYLNEVRIGRGPGRCNPAFQRFDTYDIRAALRPGRNQIAVLFHVYGVDMAWYEVARAPWQAMFGSGAFWAEGEVVSGKATTLLDTSEAWRWLVCDAWRRDVPRAGWGQDFIEDVDAALLPQGWVATDHDDRDWPFAQRLVRTGDAEDCSKGFVPVSPFPTLVPTPLSHAVERERRATRLLAAHDVLPDPALPIDRAPYDEMLTPLERARADGVEAMLAGDGPALLATASGRDLMLLFDMGDRHNGRPWFEVDARGGELIDLACGETHGAQYRPGAPRLLRETYLDCANMLRYRARPGRQRFEKFEWGAARFVQLVVRDAPEGFRLHGIGTVETAPPLERRGSFRCSNPFLNRLWTMGRRTVELNSCDGWIDGPGREKRQWVGDGLVHLLAALATFGPSAFPGAREFLTQTAEARRSDGLLPMFAPGDHRRDGLVIPDFCLHWICTLDHYVSATEDEEALIELWPAALGILRWFELHLAPSGLLCDIPHWHFIEWADVGRAGESAAINALYAGALRAAARLAARLGASPIERRLRERADMLAAAYHVRLWDDRRGAYRDGPHTARVSQQANAAAILFGVAPEALWPRILARIADPRRVKLTAAAPVVTRAAPFDEEEDVVAANTFFAAFVLDAFAIAGQPALAIDMLRRLYGPMLEVEQETLWESNEPHASLCHAFSASPTFILTRHLLGAWHDPMVAGKIIIAPGLDLAEEAEGVLPAAVGDVKVAWRRDGGTAALSLTLPEAATAAVRAPYGWRLAGPQPDGGGTHELRLERST